MGLGQRVFSLSTASSSILPFKPLPSPLPLKTWPRNGGGIADCRRWLRRPGQQECPMPSAGSHASHRRSAEPPHRGGSIVAVLEAEHKDGGRTFTLPPSHRCPGLHPSPSVDTLISRRASPETFALRTGGAPPVACPMSAPMGAKFSKAPLAPLPLPSPQTSKEGNQATENVQPSHRGRRHEHGARGAR